MSLLHRRMMLKMIEEDEEMELKEITSGSLTGNEVEIEVDGLTEFYMFVNDVNTDSATQEAFQLWLNGFRVYGADGLANNHAWKWYWFWHFKRLPGGISVVEFSGLRNGDTKSNSSTYPCWKVAQTGSWGAKDVVDKIAIKFAGNANVTNGTYTIIGR